LPHHTLSLSPSLSLDTLSLSLPPSLSRRGLDHPGGSGRVVVFVGGGARTPVLLLRVTWRVSRGQVVVKVTDYGQALLGAGGSRGVTTHSGKPGTRPP
jgi:hypothetical protein